MKRSIWICIDILYQIILLLISFFLLFFFFQESNLYGDGRLFLIVEYFWVFLVCCIFITIQLLKPLSKENFPFLMKSKKKILLIQHLVAFLPIIVLSFNEYSLDKYFIWCFCFGLFIISVTYLYCFLMKKIF